MAQPPPGGFGGPGPPPGGQPPGGQPPGGQPPGGYPPQQGFGPQPGYPPQQGFGPQPGYPPQQGFAPQPGYPQPPMGAPPGHGPSQPGWVRIVGRVFLVLGILGLLGTVAAGANSESDGMMMASLTVGPLMFGIVVSAMSGKDAQGGAGKPIGCGCAAWFAAGLALFVFFQAIWPSL